jgi:hypothetical protein
MNPAYMVAIEDSRVSDLSASPGDKEHTLQEQLNAYISYSSDLTCYIIISSARCKIWS